MPKKDDADRRTIMQIELAPSEGIPLESLSVIIKYKHRSCDDPISVHITGSKLATPVAGTPLYLEVVAYDKKPNWLKELPGG